jgi:hypothetical protein
LMDIDEAPPVILSATGPDGRPLYDGHFVAAGDVITLSMARLAGDPSDIVSLANARVLVGGIQQTPTSLTPPDASGVSQIQFALSVGLPGGLQPLTAGERRRISRPYWVTLAPPPSTAPASK